MRIGVIMFKDGDLIQGWNPQHMTPKVRKEVADCLEEIATHMRNDEFEEEDGYVKRPYVRKNKRKHQS